MSLLKLAVKAGSITDVNPGVMFYGDPGSGKTHAAVAGGNPLVLLLEANGLSTIIRANPEAHVVTVTGLDQIREAMILAKDGTLRKEGFDRLVIDSLTELQRMFKDEIVAHRSKADVATMGHEGFSQQEWGFLTEKMRRFLRTLRSLPIPIVVTALASEIVESLPSGNRLRIRPSFEGKRTASETAQYFNAIALMVKRSTEDGIKHVAVFDGPERYVTKACGHACSGIVEPDVVRFLSAIGDPSKDQPQKTEDTE